jgi:hypothetical protein
LLVVLAVVAQAILLLKEAVVVVELVVRVI